jgi:hypothetical protein
MPPSTTPSPFNVISSRGGSEIRTLGPPARKSGLRALSSHTTGGSPESEVVGDDLQPDAARLGVQEFLVVGPSGRPVLNMSVRKGSRISLDASASEIS